MKAIMRQIDEKRIQQTKADGIQRPTSSEIWVQIKDIVLKTLLSV